MRWLKILGSVVLLFCGAVWVFTYTRSQSFYASKPDDAAPPPVFDVPEVISTIVLPVRVSLSAIQNAINSGLPSGGEKTDRDTVPVLKDDTSRTRWKRGPLTLAIDGSNLTLGGNVSAEYRVDGKLLFARTHAEANANGSASISMSPNIQDNWSIRPNLNSFKVNLEEASIEIAGITISVRTKASDAIKRIAEEKIPKLESEIVSSDIIRATVSKKWAEFCSSRRLGPVDGSTLPAYLEIQPIAASAGQPSWDAGNVNFLFGIEARISVKDVATAPVCPFPEKLKLIPPQANGEFSLVVPIKYAFDAVNGALKSSISGRTFKDNSRNLDVEVRSLKISPAHDKLLVAADITIKKSGILGFVDGRASGTVYLLAKPLLDANSKILRLREAKMNAESQKALSSAFGQLAVAAVETVLSREAGFSYANELDKVRLKANSAIVDLATKPGPVKFGAEIKDLNVRDLVFDREKLVLIAVATGSANSEVEQIGGVAP